MQNQSESFDEAKAKMKKRKKPIEWSAVSFIAAHLLPAFIMIAIFYVYCNFQSFFMAFQRRKLTTSGWELNWTWENFKNLFDMTKDGPILKEALLNTLMWWCIQITLVVLGLFTSYFIYKRITGSVIFRVVFLIPGLISAVVMTFIISSMLNAQGFIAKWVQKIHNLETPPNLLYDKEYTMKWLIIKSFPFAIASNMLIWVGTMSRIPDSVIESGKMDGASWLTEMFRLVIPMILPAVGITLCSNISGLFNANGGEFLYTQGKYGTMTLSTYMYLKIVNTSGLSNTHNEASALGWLMTLVIAPLIIVTRHWMNKIGEVEY